MPINSDVERKLKEAAEVLFCYIPSISKTEYIVFVRMIHKSDK
jgi:hypothetical protein